VTHTVFEATQQRPSDRPVAALLGDDFSSLSVVVPTRNEASNIDALLERLRHATRDVTAEVIFVDDSDDDTPLAIELAVEQDRSLDRTVVLHREPAERWGGLGGAVLEGIRAATAPCVCVIDADLQHPPEVIPELLAVARTSGTGLVIASRYVGQGAAAGLGALRLVVSRLSTIAAKVAFPGILLGVTDPMSGFFLIRRGEVDIAGVEPNGFKVLLELIVANPRVRVNEVAYVFSERSSGTSKSSLREGWRYLRRLCELRLRASRPTAHRATVASPLEIGGVGGG
jgi:dolichol-phosphate mannosyltransferase